MENIIYEIHEECSRYKTAVRSDIGGRDEQQDYAYINIGKQLFAVLCDGMGGMSSGKAAGELTVRIMHSEYSAFLKDSKNKEVTLFMHEAMAYADENVARSFGGMAGTTMVAVHLNENELHWISAGDSRLYIFRNSELIQATRDHNYFLKLNEMLESNRISPERYKYASHRGPSLISYIGMGGISLFDLTQKALTVHPEDIIMLATDGLFKALRPQIIKEVLAGHTDLDKKADELMSSVKALVEEKKRDNTTFILIRIL